MSNRDSSSHVAPLSAGQVTAGELPYHICSEMLCINEGTIWQQSLCDVAGKHFPWYAIRNNIVYRHDYY